MTPKIYSENFQPIRDIVFVETDKDTAKEKTLPSGIILVMDDRYNPHQTWNTRQDGIVKILPSKLSKNKPIEVSVDDKVYFHHFGCNEENKVLINDKPHYKILYESLYCKVNGTIEMLNDFNLVEPIMESEEEIKTKSGIWLKREAGAKLLTGMVKYLSSKMKSCGIKENDTVFFEKHADCEVLIEGKNYYRIKDRSFLFVVRDGEIFPVFDFIVVKKDEIQEETVGGIVIPISAERKEVFATVVAVGAGKEDYDMSCKEGDKVFINNNVGTEINFKGEKLFVFKEDAIYGIVE